ncbi:MAG: hypothetical protein Roseis2KO_09150 [Roseivirga sp.]
MSFKSSCDRSLGNVNAIEGLPIRHIPNSISKRPKLALVVPFYVQNHKDLSTLDALATSIKKQTTRPHKVIFIDDHSPVKYALPDDFFVIRLDKNKGPATARNVGKAMAAEYDCDIIAFTDSDCILKENWVDIIIEGFRSNTRFNALSGHTKSLNKGWYDQYHDINGTLNGRRFNNRSTLLYGTTSNLAITAQVNNQIKFNEYFPNAAGEDIEFCFRVLESGFQIGHCCEMTVFHDFGYNGNALRNFNLFRQQFKRYGKGENLLLKEIPGYYSYFEQTVEISNFQQCKL